MRIDPQQNFVIQEAQRHWGAITITRVGDMTPWQPWHNVRPIVVKAFDFIEEHYWLGRFMSRAAATQMDKRFKQVGRFGWFFRVCQFFVGLGERFVVTVLEPS